MQDVRSPTKWGRSFALWTTAMLFSIILNLAFFSLLPGLTSKTPAKPEDTIHFQMVNVVRVKRREIPPKKKEIKRLKEQEKPQKKPLRNPLLKKQFKIKTPKIPFEINPKLPAGHGTLPTFPMEMVNLNLSGFKDAYSIGELDGPLTPLVRVPPMYPMIAKRRGIEGWVKVKFLVTEQGGVDRIEILEANPEKIFDQSVVRCVSSWRFSPGKVQGEPVNTWVMTTIRFELES